MVFAYPHMQWLNRQNLPELSSTDSGISSLSVRRYLAFNVRNSVEQRLHGEYKKTTYNLSL